MKSQELRHTKERKEWGAYTDMRKFYFTESKKFLYKWWDRRAERSIPTENERDGEKHQEREKNKHWGTEGDVAEMVPGARDQM